MQFTKKTIIFAGMKYIAIDPDTSASGVAVLDTVNKTVELSNCTMVGIIYKLIPEIQRLTEAVQVYIESVGHTKHNFHFRGGESRHKGSAMGFDVGRCAQVQKTIVEFLEYKEIEHTVVMPLRKCWKGAGGKITHEELKSIVENAGWEFKYKKSNQEQRDAALIAWHFANLPIQLYSQ